MAMTFRTDAEVDHALTSLADREGVSRQEVLRRAVLERYEWYVHAAKVEEAGSRLSERWGDVLDRLGSV